MKTEPVFNCCAFCPTEKLDLYKCPKCSKFYCSIKCYRNKSHVGCSENFYKECIEEKLGYEVGPPKTEKMEPKTAPNRPKTTFEEYMNEFKNSGEKNEDQLNPQIEVGKDEQVMFDSDDEPDYLLDVCSKTMKDFETIDMDELDRQMLMAGISPGFESTTNNEAETTNQIQLENLYAQLNADERKAFERLAEEVFEDSSIQKSCFTRKK